MSAGRWGDPNNREEEQKEALDPIAEDSAIEELSFEAQRRLLLAERDWTGYRKSGQSYSKPCKPRKFGNPPSILRRTRSVHPKPQLSPPVPLRENYLRGSSVFDDTTTASLASLPRSTPPRLPSLSSLSHRSDTPFSAGTAKMSQNLDPATAAGFPSSSRRGVSPPAPLRSPDQSAPLDPRAATESVMSRFASSPRTLQPQPVPSTTASTAQRSAWASKSLPPRSGVKDDQLDRAEEQQEILPFPRSPDEVVKLETAPFGSAYSSSAPALEPTVISGAAQPEALLQRALPYDDPLTSPKPSILSFPNPYLAALAETMDIAGYLDAEWPSQLSSSPAARPSLARLSPLPPFLEDDLSLSILSDRFTLVSERMGLGCTSIAKDDAIELMLRERLLRRGEVKVEAEVEGSGAESHGGSCRPREGEVDEPTDPGGQKYLFAEECPIPPPQLPGTFSTLSAIGALPSPSPSPPPLHLKLDSSLDAVSASFGNKQ
ncbi:hypothetical protein JCM11251_007001 [Rhodosporidiobolus azoricus]